MSRVELDAYYTPHKLACACVRATPLAPSDLVLEPSCGDGAFLSALQDIAPQGVRLAAMELNESAKGLQFPGLEYAINGDFTKTLIRRGQQPDWVVGNPPYLHAEEHVRRALKIAKKGVGFLLRLAFLESKKREDFWMQYPCSDIHVLSQRPSFVGGGADMAAYAWFVWKKEKPEHTKMHFLIGSWR